MRRLRQGDGAQGRGREGFGGRLTSEEAQTLESRVRAELEQRSSDGLLRTWRAPKGIDLSSNDYLALADHPAVVRRMIEVVERDGCGSGGSRLLRGHRQLFDEVERAFAAFKQTERSLYFSSGYLANLAVLSTLAQRGDLMLSDRLNHASLRDGARLSHARQIAFAHNDLDALTQLLAMRDASGHTFVITESLFSMDGDAPPLAAYADRCRAAGATLIVDEAHAVGIYGARGSGLIEAAGIDPNQVISINPAGKALGVSGAFVAGPAWAIEYLVQRARPFIFSTAPPPAVAGALLASIGLIGSEPERRSGLLALAAYFRHHLAAADIHIPSGRGAPSGAPSSISGPHSEMSSPIIPIVIGDTDRAMMVAHEMQAEGFDVRAVRPPTVAPGTARLRISVNVRLTEAMIDDAVTALSTALERSSRRGARAWHAVSS